MQQEKKRNKHHFLFFTGGATVSVHSEDNNPLGRRPSMRPEEEDRMPAPRSEWGDGVQHVLARRKTVNTMHSQGGRGVSTRDRRGGRVAGVWELVLFCVLLREV